MRDRILQFLIDHPHAHSSREIQKFMEDQAGMPVPLKTIQKALQSLHESHEIARHGGKRGRHVTYQIKRDEVA